MASSNPHHHHHHHHHRHSHPAGSSASSVAGPAASASAGGTGASVGAGAGVDAGTGGSSSASLAAPATTSASEGSLRGQRALLPPAYGYNSSSASGSASTAAAAAAAIPRGQELGQGQSSGSALWGSDTGTVTGHTQASNMSGSGPGSGAGSGSGSRSMSGPISGISAGNNGNPPPPAFRGSSYASIVSGGGGGAGSGAGSAGVAPQSLQRPSRSMSHFSTASTSYPIPMPAGTTSRATTTATGVPAYLMYPPMSGHTRHGSRGGIGDADGSGPGGVGGFADGRGGRDGAGRDDVGNNSIAHAWNRWSGQVPSYALQQGISNGYDGNPTASGSTGTVIGGGNGGGGGGAGAASIATGSSTAPLFFVPSYLRGSRHVERLEEARRARLLAQQRESRASIGTNTHHSHNGGTLSTSSSNVSLHKLATPSLPTGSASSMMAGIGSHSHRGLAHEVVERLPSGAGGTGSGSGSGNNFIGCTTANMSQHQLQQSEETLAPLPSRWSEIDRFPGLEVLAGGWQVRFASSKTGTHDEAAAVRADHPMPRRCGIYYYEVTVMSKGKEGLIGIGFSGPKVPLNRLPGWEPESWAYHGDDGFSFCCTASGKSYGPKFSSLDVIGCGVNFRTGCAFFTKNGVHLGTAFKDIKSDRLYPSVGMKKPGEHLRANFGQMPFVYDIDGMVEREKQFIQAEVNKADVTHLNPPLDETRLIQELVAQYLAHEGYVETARAFTGEMHKDSMALANGTGASVKEIGSLEDVDAVNRQKIRASILDGDIDKALKLTGAYYPSVLRENENIYFKLRCHKFVEMIRGCIELHSDMTGDSRRRRHRSSDKLQRMKRRKARSECESRSRRRRHDSMRHDQGEGHDNGFANGNGADGFAQHMELDDEQGRFKDGHQYDYTADASNGHDEHDHDHDHGRGEGANWDDMDMEDGASADDGDDGDSHGVSIVAATNGSKQKKKKKQRKKKRRDEGDGDGSGRDGADGNGSGIAQDSDDEEGEEDGELYDDDDGSDDDDDHDDNNLDDEMDEEDDEEGDAGGISRKKAKAEDKGTLQAEYNAMMQLTIQYGQELKSEFDGDPRREVKQALEETFALIAYPDARESMLAPLLDVGERVPVAEELNAAILVSLGKSSAAALENVYQQTVVLVSDLAEDGGPGALIHVGNDYMA